MMRAANQFPAETDPERFVEAWRDARRDFLLALPERNAATEFIVELWADAAIQLTEQDLKVMSRLTRAQERVGQA